MALYLIDAISFKNTRQIDRTVLVNSWLDELPAQNLLLKPGTSALLSNLSCLEYPIRGCSISQFQDRKPCCSRQVKDPS